MTATLRRFVRNVVVKDIHGERPLINLDSIGVGTGKLCAGAQLHTAEAGQNIAAEPGDVLFSKLRPYLRKSLPVSQPVFASSEFLCLRPDPELVDSGWLLHVTQSERWIEHSVATSYGSKMPRTSWDAMAEFRLDPPALDKQRRIAEFLDDQVARIDEVIRLREEQIRALDEWRWLNFVERIGASAPVVPLRRVLRFIADGPFGSAFSSADYVDDGPAVIRLGNIGFAEFRDADIARVPKPIYDAFPRSHVYVGDLLIASLGDPNNHAGRACVAPATLGAAMVKGKCFVARTNDRLARADYIALTLSSPIGAAALAAFGRGSTRNMVNIDLMRTCSVPMPSLNEQSVLVEYANETNDTVSHLRAEMREQNDALLEQRRSMVSAAVSGEFDVVAASGRGI